MNKKDLISNNSPEISENIVKTVALNKSAYIDTERLNIGCLEKLTLLENRNMYL